MVDITMIQQVMSSLSLAADMAKTMIGVRDAAVIQGKVIELQGIILSAQSNALAAQSDQFALLNQIRELEEEVTRIKAWEAEKQKYQLDEPRPGLFTYALKQEAGASEPAHQICANCYQHSHKSILQRESRSPGRCDVLVCNDCGSAFYLTGAPHSDHVQRMPRPPSR